jgi:hypothetical protein
MKHSKKKDKIEARSFITNQKDDVIKTNPSNEARREKACK